MVELRCDQCLFWEEIEQSLIHDVDEKAGACKRYPPVYDVAHAQELYDRDESGAEQNVWSWEQPLTVASNWCGEFESLALKGNMH